MKKLAEELQKIIQEYSEKLKKVSEHDFSERPAPGKWSRKEELGHLVDSAHNNLRRFIVAQHEQSPKIVYNQNLWVEVNNYHNRSSSDLVMLWKLMNEQVCEVWKSMPEENFNKSCDTGKEIPELHSIQWLAEDYIKHLKHHLHHLLKLEAIPY